MFFNRLNNKSKHKNKKNKEKKIIKPPYKLKKKHKNSPKYTDSINHQPPQIIMNIKKINHKSILILLIENPLPEIKNLHSMFNIDLSKQMTFNNNLTIFKMINKKMNIFPLYND
jgi:hypothetical protein